MIEIFLFSSFLLNSASAIPANNFEWRPNVLPLELEVPAIGSEPDQKYHIIGIKPIELESINQYENQIEQKKRELAHPKIKDQVWLEPSFDDQLYPEFSKKDNEEMLYEPIFNEYPEISFRKTPSLDLNLYKKHQPQKKDRNGMQEEEIWNDSINQLYRARKLRSGHQ